ncbi:SPOR domain-containing protein [Actinotalea sp. M2MS4P-6]|uniref:SPOR domain-containing protein n=1 Tax=Actinotalea sp. M2MS4P-6 TaxID=2983762 RepID=UPI0021E3B9E5|nr:SPOR domain-containing protein [Actinotalea sp. M2MS4P-6]MCV2393803.1 SPOR domain-containing protein [Actinotalea sp. M2MS4P-6]
MAEYWFNIETRQVEVGHRSPWDKLMGPYPTREAAERALSTAHERSDAWDEADREWREE